MNKCWKLATNKPGKNIAQLLSSMDREGRAFHLDADDVVPVDDHKDNVEEDQEEAGAVSRFHQDNTSTTNHEVATTDTFPNRTITNQQDGGPPPHQNPTPNPMNIGNTIYPLLDDESTLRASNSMNVNQAQDRDRTVIAPSSVTSLRSEASGSTKAKLRRTRSTRGTCTSCRPNTSIDKMGFMAKVYFP